MSKLNFLKLTIKLFPPIDADGNIIKMRVANVKTQMYFYIRYDQDISLSISYRDRIYALTGIYAHIYYRIRI